MTFQDRQFNRRADKVVALAAQTPAFSFLSPDDDDGPVAMPMESEERMTVAGLLCRTGLTLIFGKGNSMKTWFALSVMVHCAAVGPKAPTHVYHPATGMEITRRGRSTIYTAEDTYERVDRRIWSIIVNDLGMDADSDDAKATRRRIRVVAPLSMTDEQFPFDTAYLFDDEGPSGRFASNEKSMALVNGMNQHNAGRDADDPHRQILLVVDSVTTTGGMELTDNKESTVFCWFLNKRSIAGDFAVLALAHSVKSANPDKLDPEAGRAERLAGGFAWSTNVRATIEVRRPLGQSYSKGRGGKVIADEWWETQGLPDEHSRAIVIQVAKENVGGMSDMKMWFSPRRAGQGAFRDITKLMSDRPRSIVQFIERGGAKPATSAANDEDEAMPSNVDRSKAKALVLEIAKYIVKKEDKAITANAIQSRLRDEYWKKRDKHGIIDLKPAQGGFASNGTKDDREREGSPRWILDQFVKDGLMIRNGTRFSFVTNDADEEDDQ
jgi:hypothetical protein